MELNTEFIETALSCGFEREQALRALALAGNNPDAAFDMLVSGSVPSSENYKMVILVRGDLQMGVGKIAAQVGHAVLGAYKDSSEIKIREWEEGGSAKIVLRVSNLKELMDLHNEAHQKGLVAHTIQDAGRTQVDPGTVTVCAIGPDAVSKIDSVTSHLSLL